MTSTLTQATQAPAADAIRPFQFRASDEALADLRRRIQATRFPEKETVAISRRACRSRRFRRSRAIG